MLSFMWWLVVGLVAGILGRFFVPGRQPMGFLLTILLGLIGSIVGGAISSVLFGQDPTDPGFHPAGLVMSTIGAIIVLWAYVAYGRRQQPGDRSTPL